MAVLKDLIVHGRSRFINGAQFNTINAESIGATEGIFNKLIATTLEAKEATIDDLTATNATIVGLLDVQGEMHTKSWSNSNIATIDGNFYITPTVVSADGADVTASGYTPTGTLTYSSGNYTQMTIAGTFDTSQLTLDDVLSIDWPANSYVIITGEVSVGKEWYPLGTIRGKLGVSIAKGTGAAAKSITIVPIGTQIISGEVGNVSLTDGNGHKPSTLEAIRIAISETSGASLNSLKLRKIKISMTSRASGNDQYALGIYMTAMGSNKKTFLDIYGGSNKNGENVSQTINNITYQSGALAIPTVRIGNLLGLPMVGGVTPKGWGIYTNNGFFTGTIVARQGKIGNGNAAWTIGNDSNTGAAYIYTGNLGASPSAYVSTGYGTISIANSGALTGNKKWVFTAGDKFGVTNEGDLYASNATINGDIVAQSLTIGSGANAYSGIAAINISGYSIEIEVVDIAGSTNTKKLIPHLYHNGMNADSEVTDVTKFLWYIDNNMSMPGAAGLSPDGYIIGEYGHTYKVIYDFGDGVVGSGSAIQTRTVDPSKYITRIDANGITIHPETQNGNSSIRLDGNGMELFNSSNESIARYGNTAKIGLDASSRFLINASSLQAYNNNNQLYFEVNANGLSWGSNTAATTTQVNAAAQTASKYITAVDQNGIKVHAENGTNVNYSLINGEGLEVFQGTSASDTKSVAKFGSTARIGKETGANTKLSNASIIMFDGQSPILQMSSTGATAQKIDIYKSRESTSTGSSGSFDVDFSDSSVAYVLYIYHNNHIIRSIRVSSSTPTISSSTQSTSVRYDSNTTVSVRTTVGYTKYTESGSYSISISISGVSAENVRVSKMVVLKYYIGEAPYLSFGSRDESKNKGAYSATFGAQLSGQQEDQFVIGKYNDNKTDTVLEIGNGTDNAHSNALTVDWDGNVEAAGEVAGVVHTYGAITGGTWSSKSIGTGSTWKELANFTIPEDGVWLLIAELIYASNATGHRTMTIATSSATSGVGIYTDRRQAVNSTETPLRVVAVVQGNTKYYVNTYHGASTAISCQGRYTAFKIGNGVNKIGG